MALIRNPVSTRLSLKFYVGDDLEGNPIARQTSYQVKSGTGTLEY